MFKIFKNVRINALRGKDLKKYMIYVLGEILLIVIGILFAHDDLSNQYIRDVVEPYIHDKLEFRTINYVAEWYENDQRETSMKLVDIYSDHEFENILIGSRDRTENYLEIYKKALMLAQELYLRLESSIDESKG